MFKSKIKYKRSKPQKKEKHDNFFIPKLFCTILCLSIFLFTIVVFLNRKYLLEKISDKTNDILVERVPMIKKLKNIEEGEIDINKKGIDIRSYSLEIDTIKNLTFVLQFDDLSVNIDYWNMFRALDIDKNIKDINIDSLQICNNLLQPIFSIEKFSIEKSSEKSDAPFNIIIENMFMYDSMDEQKSIFEKVEIRRNIQDDSWEIFIDKNIEIKINNTNSITKVKFRYFQDKELDMTYYKAKKSLLFLYFDDSQSHSFTTRLVDKYVFKDNIFMKNRKEKISLPDLSLEYLQNVFRIKFLKQNIFVKYDKDILFTYQPEKRTSTLFPKKISFQHKTKNIYNIKYYNTLGELFTVRYKQRQKCVYLKYKVIDMNCCLGSPINFTVRSGTYKHFQDIFLQGMLNIGEEKILVKQLQAKERLNKDQCFNIQGSGYYSLLDKQLSLDFHIKT